MKVKWKLVLVYLDDILIFLYKSNEFIGDVRQVLRLLHHAGVTLESRNVIVVQSILIILVISLALDASKYTRSN